MPIFEIEQNSTNFISESERKGRASDLFWPWCGANVSLLALSYGAFFLDFGISFWQATIAAIVGTVFSFLLVGFSSLAGKRSNAPTMTLSRAAFGVIGNRVPGFLSYLLFVGWETVLVSLATLATGTIVGRLGTIDRNSAMAIGFLIAVSLTVIGGVYGFDAAMKLQKWLALITLIMTALYLVLTANSIDWAKVSAIPNGSLAAVIGATVFAMTGIGLGWANSAADYSRYLPRNVNGGAVVGWTVFGASLVPILLVIYGVLLSGTSDSLHKAIASDPIGALTEILPTWFLLPFALVAIFGLISGAILDLYSSGIALVSIGVPVKRHQAAIFDALIMTFGTVYIVWFAKDFIGPFQGFLISIGVPIATWTAIFAADVLLVNRKYLEKDFFNPNGVYGAINWRAISVLITGTVVGFGFVTNPWFSWQGYFMDLIGGKTGQWAYANLGVIFALVIGFVGQWLLQPKRSK